MSNQYLYSIQDIENNEDLFFNTDELSGSDCYWTDSDSNESAIESENEGNTMSRSVEERPILMPQRRQFLFAARPAAVNITGWPSQSESNEINEQPCSSRSVPKLRKAPAKKKNARPTPHNKRKRCNSNTSDSRRPTSDNTSSPQQSASNASDLSSMWEDFPAPADNASATPMDTWLPTFTSNVGFFYPNNDMSAASPIEFFYLFLDDEFWNLVVTQTNLYAEQFSCTDISRNSRFVSWKPVDITTIKKYIGLCLLMGLVSKHEIADYWKIIGPTKTPEFGKIMARNKFQLIRAFIHFADNTTMKKRNEDGYDRQFKIRPIIDLLTTKFFKYYLPSKELSIDEMTIAYKGRSFLKQYNAKKKQ